MRQSTSVVMSSGSASAHSLVLYSTSQRTQPSPILFRLKALFSPIISYLPHSGEFKMRTGDVCDMIIQFGAVLDAKLSNGP